MKHSSHPPLDSVLCGLAALSVCLPGFWQWHASAANEPTSDHERPGSHSLPITSQFFKTGDPLRTSPPLNDWPWQGDLAAALNQAVALPASEREEAMGAVLAAWVRHHPDGAGTLADLLRQNHLTGPAWQAFAAAWSESAPATVADFALALPAGSDRTFTLHVALDQWMLMNPEAASAWSVRLSEPREFDYALASLICHTDPLFRPTSEALDWAESISDPSLRDESLAHVIREWAAREPAAALHFVDTSPCFQSAQRRRLIDNLTPSATEL